MRNARFLAVALAFFAIPAAFAEQPANQLKGFNANNVYQVNDYDSINAFNGNLTISIPIGNPYPIAEGAAFQLVLHSNSNIWDPEEYLDGDCTAEPGNIAYAHRRANAGMGWILTLGRLFSPGHPTNDTGWAYESPDGSEHNFNSEGGMSDDETYLRMTVVSPSIKTIEFPDGTKHYFSPADAEETFWRLDKVTRRVGVGVGTEMELYRIAYTDDTWTITDAHGREHVLTFVAVRHLATPEVGYDGNLDHRMIKSVQFDDGAQYNFEYRAPTLGRQLDMHTLKKSCMSIRTRVWMLSGLERPDGSRFSFDYYEDPYGIGPVGLPIKMTLPTGGAVEWHHGHYGKPTYSATEIYYQYSWGVQKRRLHPRGSTSTQEWLYEVSQDDDAIPNNADQPNLTPVYQLTKITDPVGKVTENYFDITYNVNTGNSAHHYSRPYTSLFKDSLDQNRWLSQKVYSPNPGTTPLQLRQTTYVQYEDEDPQSDGPPKGGRVKSQRVIQNDDGGLWTATTNDDFDGYGHYRTSTISGTALSNITRTTQTNFTRNPNDGTATGRITIPSGEPWITGLYNFVQTTEVGGAYVGTTSSRTDVCMDAKTGLVQGKRVQRGGDWKRDLYSFFTYDSQGNTAAETFFGGDANELQPGSAPLCTSPGGTAPYKLTHAYASGVRRETKYDGVSFKSADMDVDGPTARPTTSRDSALVPTKYEYDNMGRVTAVRPTGSAWTEYTYSTASASAPASVTATQWKEDTAAAPGQELTIARYYYDGFGRMVQQSRKMPGTWSTTWIEYDVLGRKTRETTSQATATGDYATFPTSAKTTRWVYDALGRTVSVTQPDEKAATFAYTGSRQTRRTVNVATTEGSEAPVTVWEDVDGLGRLVKVTEDANGAAEVTNYEYDVADRLRWVRLENGATAVRKFNYDNAGFLTSELHPESGTTSFEYDSRGHISKRTTALGTVMAYTYDKAERLTAVTADGLAFKTFVFDRPSSGSDKSLGKLDYAIRYNRHDALPGGVQVKETYDYTGPGGAVFKKKTEVGSQTFSDQYRYDELGAIKTIDYPTCTGCVGLTAPARSVTSTRSFGLTTNVGAYAKDIQYHANGMLKQVRHLNSDGTDGPLYEQTLATNTMARPERIKVSYYCKDLNPTAPYPAQQPADAGQNFTINIAMPAGGTSIQWYERTASGETMVSGATGTSLTRTADVTRSYFARVKNDTCSADSAVATVNVATTCASPSTAIVMPDTLVAFVATTAGVSPTPGASYVWTLEGSGSITAANSPTVSFTPGCAGTVKLKVKVTTSCGESLGETAQYPVQRAKAAVSGSITLPNRDNPAQIQLALSGLGPWSVTWSDGASYTVPANTPVTTRSVLPPTGSSSQTYTVTSIVDAAGCAGTSEGSAVVTIGTTSCTPPSSNFTALESVLSSWVEGVYITPAANTTYSWTITNGHQWSVGDPHEFTFQAGCSGVVTITLTATETICGLSSTTTKHIPINPPHTTVDPEPKIYVRGDPPLQISFVISAVGGKVRWSDGTQQSNLQAPWTPNTYYRSVQPSQTTTYSIVDVRDYQGCPGTSSGSVVVTVCDAPVVAIQAPATIAPGETGTASVPALAGATYSWGITGGTLVGGATTSSVTFTPSSSCAGSVNLTVTVTTSCGVVRTGNLPVPVTPTTAVASGTATISQSSSTLIRATLTGVGPWMVKWSDQPAAVLVSASPYTRSVTPMGTTTYTIATATDARGCAATVSGQAVVTVIPPVPTVVTATAVTTTQVNVSWSYSGTADQFIVNRNGANVATLSSSSARSYVDGSVLPTQAYVYRVLAVKNQVVSSPSTPDLATTVIFEDDPLLAIHGMRAQHLLQLRTAVNAVRSAAGLSAASFTDPSLAEKEVKAVHFNELRTSLDSARSLLELPGASNERWPLQPGFEMWIADILALRGGVQ